MAGRETGSEGSWIGRRGVLGAITAAATISTTSAASIRSPSPGSRADSDLTVDSPLATSAASADATTTVTIARS